MAKRSKSKKKKTKRRISPTRATFFLLFLASAAVVLWDHQALVQGLRGYLLGRIEYDRIESRGDLPSGAEGGARAAEVIGIPDYKHVYRFPYEGVILTCYRIVDFGNRLCVCSDKGLARPEAIDEVIRKRTLRGRLEPLAKSPLRHRVRRVFLRGGKIRLPEDAFLLREDPTPLPSLSRLALPVTCLLLCCLFAYRVIKE